MRKYLCAVLVAFGCFGAGLAAHAQQEGREEVYTVWVITTGSGPQRLYFGYGRTVELAEELAFRGCGDACTIVKSGPGCLTLVVNDQELYPAGCRNRAKPEAPGDSSNL